MPRSLTSVCVLWCAAALAGLPGAAHGQVTPPPAAVPSQSAELAEAERLDREAVALFTKRKFDEALPLAERAVALRERALGPDHVLVGDALGHMAALLYAKRKHKEAEAALRRQLVIYEKAQEGVERLSAPLHLYLCVLHDTRRREEQGDLQLRIFKLENGFDLPAERAKRVHDALPRRAVSKPAPRYPAEARDRRSTGSVLMKVAVDETGAVSSVTALCGPPELRASAAHAAARNRYEPFVVGGRPVAVKGFITYTFTIR